jgi:hypothetical protein
VRAESGGDGCGSTFTVALPTVVNAPAPAARVNASATTPLADDVT